MNSSSCTSGCSDEILSRYITSCFHGNWGDSASQQVAQNVSGCTTGCLHGNLFGCTTDILHGNSNARINGCMHGM